MRVELDRHPAAGIFLNRHPDFAIGSPAEESLRFIPRDLRGRMHTLQAHFQGVAAFLPALRHRGVEAHDISIPGEEWGVESGAWGCGLLAA